ncbi:MAG: winged helix-turn-helix domain-containing protein, partial [Acidobacteriota bacterium]|nr:winged helix-turn-helix domain-containing protein [Acidobacteriota bacterium]
MSILKAVEIVLKEEKAPLHYRKITERIIKSNLWQAQGETPEHSVNSQLSTDIIKHGKSSRFQRVDKGTFALRAWGLTEFIPKDGKEIDYGPGGGDPAVAPSKTVSFTNAAEQVLEKFSNRKPMHYRAITEKALELGLVQTAGRTPEATLYVQILTEIERKTKRGETPRFAKYGKGFIGLSRWNAQGLAFQIDQHNNSTKEKLRALLHAMEPAEFEELVGRLLAALG